MADLEDVADLAAEMASPDEVPAARRRRRGWSAAGLVALLTAGTGETAAAGGAAAAPAARTAGRRLPPRPRLLGTALAVVGAGVLCAGLLLHLPSADSLPLSGGQAYSTPTPYPSGNGAALQPVPIDPTSPAPLVTAAPLSSPAPRAAAPRLSAPGGAAPAATPAVTLSPVVAGPTSPRPLPPPPSAAPATTATAAPSPSAAPAGPLTVQSVTLSMGTCENQGGWWVCPETATFTFQPGGAGTLTFSIAGTDVGCSGTSSAFDQPQKAVTIPQGTTRAVVTSALVFPASSHPAAAGPGGTPSTGAVKVTSPNQVESASQPFGSASCP
jgi:hypothetical protein